MHHGRQTSQINAFVLFELIHKRPTHRRTEGVTPEEEAMGSWLSVIMYVRMHA